MSMVGGCTTNNKYPGHVRVAAKLSLIMRGVCLKKVQIKVEIKSGHSSQVGLTQFIKHLDSALDHVC